MNLPATNSLFPYTTLFRSDGNSGGNYTVTTHTATGTISKAALDISASSQRKEYDGTTRYTATPTYSGLQTGDSLSVSQVFQSRNVLGTNGSTLVASYSLTD